MDSTALADGITTVGTGEVIVVGSVGRKSFDGETIGLNTIGESLEAMARFWGSTILSRCNSGGDPNRLLLVLPSVVEKLSSSLYKNKM